MMADKKGRVTIESSSSVLETGFEWAKSQALSYVSDGNDPVGKWYEAALPGRDAFCMRDVAHQSTGANVLGLQDYNKNMLRRFAENISESKDWCSYWEINKHGNPAPVDYNNDGDFWYNLPANFDVLHCCYRQYLWTGDDDYIHDPVFINFYNRTVCDYVDRWDIDGDGLMEYLPQYGRRGLPSYNESKEAREKLQTGGDLVAAQYAAYVAYAEIQHLRGKDGLANEYLEKAAQLRDMYNTRWWDEENKRYHAGVLQDHTFYRLYHQEGNFMSLYFGITEKGRKTELALDDLTRNSPPNVEGKSYLPEILYRFGRNETAYGILCDLMNPDLSRREYPEVSYSVVGSIITGTMGIYPDARHRLVSTLPRLSGEVDSITVRNLPLMGTEVTVSHHGCTETVLTNESDSELEWVAKFPVQAGVLIVDGTRLNACRETGSNQHPCSMVKVTVGKKETRKVEIPPEYMH